MIDNDVKVIIAKVFSIPESEVNDESGPENIENWDSFNGLILVDELENHFKIIFLTGFTQHYVVLHKLTTMVMHRMYAKKY